MKPGKDSLSDLSPSEKLQLIEDLWDSLSAVPDAVPVHDWQKEELARREANLAKNPDSGLAWDEVEREVGTRRLPDPGLDQTETPCTHAGKHARKRNF